jgi:hypothetical protein
MDCGVKLQHSPARIAKRIDGRRHHLEDVIAVQLLERGQFPQQSGIFARPIFLMDNAALRVQRFLVDTRYFDDFPDHRGEGLIP